MCCLFCKHIATCTLRLLTVFLWQWLFYFPFESLAVSIINAHYIASPLHAHAVHFTSFPLFDLSPFPFIRRFLCLPLTQTAFPYCLWDMSTMQHIRVYILYVYTTTYMYDAGQLSSAFLWQPRQQPEAQRCRPIDRRAGHGVEYITRSIWKNVGPIATAARRLF